MNNIDLIIIGIILLFGFIGYSKGFFLSLVSLLKYIVAIIGTKILSPIVISFLWETPLKENVYQFISKKLSALNMNSLLFSNSDTQYTSLQMPFLENLFKNSLIQVGDSFSELFTRMSISAIGMLITFLALLFVLSIVSNLINSTIQKSKTLSSTNKFLGFLLGFLTSLLIIVIILVVTAPFIYTNSINESIANSQLLKVFYNSDLYISTLSDWTSYITLELTLQK